ncbi:hypothetical protein DICVIV_03443 [Dictyocaulus viviparus]|uniref:Uncharacterized protein n=1 Tax=Dictyocaulus viviparus TaxID=29172 RepID=A0A0D8Y2N8_DICVI|nr:hypothetical protein DICVIV_03443 [Dictyocaulus viviparus]
MFRGPGVLSALLCPKTDCKRVNCRFYHEGQQNPTMSAGGCIDVPFPCEPQDYKFAFSKKGAAEESGSTVSSSSAHVEALPFCPYRLATSNVIGDLPIDLNRIYSIADFGYLPHIPSVEQHYTISTNDDQFTSGANSSYYGTSSKYAPEEPTVYNHASFSGYAPAPSPSTSVNESPSCAVNLSYFDNTESNNQIGCESPKHLFGPMNMIRNNQTGVSYERSEDSFTKDADIKASTAKKIKTLPLPKVGLSTHASKSRSDQFKEYVGEVARLNEEIERLQRLQEQITLSKALYTYMSLCAHHSIWSVTSYISGHIVPLKWWLNTQRNEFNALDSTSLKQEAKKIAGSPNDFEDICDKPQTSNRRFSFTQGAPEEAVRCYKHSRESFVRQKPAEDDTEFIHKSSKESSSCCKNDLSKKLTNNRQFEQ